MNRPTLFVLLMSITLAGVLHARAQAVTTIYSFTTGPQTPQASLTLGPDGNFYGTSSGGLNINGTVFKVTTNGIMTTLVNFNGSNGSKPAANLLLASDGNFYGTTSDGGTNVSGINATGTVFKMTTNGTLTTLVSFNGANGGIPLAGLALGLDGNYYGTTEFGGLNADGTVFRITTNGTLTTLISFNGTNGANPFGGLTPGPGGNLYGTTRYGGTNGNFGTVFAVTTNGAFYTLFNFSGTNGAGPFGALTVGPDGNLYGTTSDGTYLNGASDGGTVFEMTTNGMLTTLVTMTGFFGSIYGTSNGVSPHAGLTLGPDGNFYGTTYAGGTNGSGAVFQVTTNGTLARLTQAGIPYQIVYNYFGVPFAVTNGPNITEVFNGTMTTLYSFTAQTNFINADGAQPQASLTLGLDGNFYGTASGGGTNGYGTTFRVTTNGTFTTLASFIGNNGDTPEDGLTAGPNGILYGTAKTGGTSSYGTAFKLTIGGGITTLVNFDRANDGANPQGDLIFGPDGNLYGTTVGGGTNLLQTGPSSYQVLSDGTVFTLTTNGIFRPLAYFNGTNGANPYGGLAMGPEGNLYGTTGYGGISNDGTIFQITTNGTLTTLTNFTGANGATPFASLTLGRDGNFYGTSQYGGINNNGTVFQVTTNGTLNTLVNFYGNNGAYPMSGLLLGPDGNFYGTAYFGGARNDGTVFQVTPGGTLTTLVNFAQTNGEFPVGGLALGPDGNFYGTTELGGVSASAGTVFKMTTNGTLTTLYSFVYSATSANGNYPFGTLTLQTNGNFIRFYGTTYNGGSGGGGTVFQLNLTTAYAMAENSTNTFYPLTNEVAWVTGGTLNLVSTAATNGTVQITGSGIVFKPTANFIGTATINYSVTNNAGGTNVSVITVLVTNLPPVANPDVYTVAGNSSANVFSPLANDQVVTSGGVLKLVSVSPTNGTAVISGTNVLFTPQANFAGTATIGYTITDNVGGTNSSLITVTVSNPLADLSLSANAAPEPVGVGSNLVYSLTVSNAGPSSASGVTVSNQIPANITFVSATGGGTPASGVLLLNVGSLTNGAVTNVEIIVQSMTAGKLTNNFQVFANELDPVLTNNSFTVVSTVTNVSVVAADLSLSANASPEPVMVGSNLVYSISITSQGPNAASGVTVSNQIPANVTFVSATGGATPTNGVLLVNLSSLANGVVTNVQVIVQPTAAGSLTNLFEVFANEFDPNVANNSATVVSTVTWGGPPGFPYAGSWTMHGIPGNPDEFTFRIGGGIGVQSYAASFTNSTGGSATDAIPGDAVLLIDPNGGNNPTNWAAVERFFNPNDPAGSNGLAATEYQTFSPAEAGPGGFANFALFPNTAYYPTTISSTTNGITTLLAIEALLVGPAANSLGVGQEADILLFASFQSSSLADLSLSASASPEPVTVGSNLVYSIMVSNAGPETATDVVISNQLPVGVTFVSATGGATPASGVLLLNLGSLTNNAVANVQVIVQPTAAGRLMNNFQVFADQTDPVLTNDLATVVSTVTNALPTGYPGFPYAGSWTMHQIIGEPNNFFLLIGGGVGVQSYPESFTNAYGGSASGGSATDAIPGDVVLLIDPNGGNNSTNWAAVERFFNPNDPAGSNGLAATEYQTFSPAEAGPGGFANFALFPNTAFFPTSVSSTTNGITTLTAIFTQYGPIAGSLGAGQIATVRLLAAFQSSSFADLSLSASIPPSGGEVGQDLVYSITVSNAGPATATGVIVSNQLPANVNFFSATGGATLTNGVLLINLGSLAEGTNISAQVIVQLTTTNQLTNVFVVFANETDPNLTNNSATVVVSNVEATATTTTSSSSAEFDTTNTTTVSQQVTIYSTELIARLPNGTVVYDQIFSAAFSDATVQAAVTQAAEDLTNAGATSYTGPTQTSFLLTTNVSSMTIQTGTNSNLIIGTKTYIGPETILIGDFGQIQSYTFDPVVTNYAIPSGWNGNPTSLTIVSGGEDIDTFGLDLVTDYDTTTITDTNLNSSVYVMTGVVSQVDLALSITAAPNPVDVGAPLTYSLTVTNNSSVTATGVIVSNTLPSNVTFVSALPGQGSATNQSGVITYNIGSLPNNDAATLAIVVIPNAAGLLTNTAVAFSAQTDSQPANNSVTNITAAVSAPITNLVLTVLSPITLNPQTGLFEQQIEVANGGPATPSSVLLLISGLAENAKLYNATGLTNGLPFVQSAAPLGIGSNVVFLLEYYVPTRVALTNLSYTVEAGSIFIPPVVNGIISSINKTTILPNGNVLVEFTAIPGQIYAIQYSSDMITWLTAVPAITAPATRVQWIDAGPPQTVSNPAQQSARYYRVVLLLIK